MKALVRFFFRLLFAPLVWWVYRMKVIGRNNLPAEGGVLLLSNHVSYIDSFILHYACPRPVRFIVREDYMHVKGVGWFLRLFGAIPIQPGKARDAITRTVEALEQGDLVCLFPEGGLTRFGVITELKKGFELIARRANCPVVPVYLDGLFQSIFSFERGRFMKKKPKTFPCRLQIAFGPVIAADQVNTDSLRQALWEQSATAFSQRIELRPSLEVATIRALKRKRHRALFIEQTRDGIRVWSRMKVLAVAVSVARRWMNDSGEYGTRIGILLPSGPIASMIQIGLTLAGRVPVILPFTLAPNDAESIARRIAPLGIRTVITSRAFMPHLADLWTGDEGIFIDMKSVVSPQGSLMTLFERVRAFLEPAWMTCWRLDLNRRDRDREALCQIPHLEDSTIFFSSSELLRDTLRVYAAHPVRRGDSFFCETPSSEGEGLVFGCWGPVLCGGQVCDRSLSLREDACSVTSLLQTRTVSHIIGSAALFGSLDDPLPDSIRFGIVFGLIREEELSAWELKFGRPVVRGWSQGGRVLSLSLPDSVLDQDAIRQKIRGSDPLSVGRLLPGVIARSGERGFHYRLGLTKADEWLSSPSKAEIAADGLVFLSEEK